MVNTHGRERRTKEREAKRAAQTSGEPAGWDIDKEEDPSSSSSLQRDHAALIEDAKLIFQDVIAEFSTLDFARDKMQLFKSTYSQLYEDAYIGLSSPSVFAPYVRLQMLSWNPLSTPTFDVMPWYSKLFDFGTVEGMADDDVIPRLVEKLAVPLIVEHYNYLWLPYDPLATTKAIEIFKEASSHLLDDSAAFGLLRTGVVDRLMKEVKLHVKTPLIPTQTPYRPIPPEDEKENTRREFAKLAFSRRQWWRGLKLFTQMARWLGVDPEMDPDMIHTMNSFFKNSLVPFFSFQVQCVCISGPEKAQKELLASVGRMCSRLSAYLPTFSDALTQANSADARALSSLVKLVKEYAQMTAEHSVNSPLSAQLSMQLSLVLNKMRATLMQLS